MNAAPARKPIVHFVGSIPLPDAETVFRTLASATGPHLKRLPDGETGVRKSWIRFLQQVLADNPAIEVASDVPPFKFTQWDGKLLREIPRLAVNRRSVNGKDPRRSGTESSHDSLLEGNGFELPVRGRGHLIVATLCSPRRLIACAQRRAGRSGGGPCRRSLFGRRKTDTTSLRARSC